jgi:hypothetical protein
MDQIGSELDVSPVKTERIYVSVSNHGAGCTAFAWKTLFNTR